MTVQELIDRLSNYPDDYEVVFTKGEQIYKAEDELRCIRYFTDVEDSYSYKDLLTVRLVEDTLD